MSPIEKAGRLGTMSKERKLYAGKVIDLNAEVAKLPDGREVELEIVRHPGGACALPIFENGDVLMIRQFRHAAGGIIWEIPTGRIDDSEEPEICARRELLEEGGVTAGRMEKICEFYTTPGFCTEKLHIYMATDLQPGKQALENDECLEIVRLPYPEALQMVHKGEINDSKTMIALLLAENKISSP